MQPARQVRSLSQLTISEGFEKNRNGRCAIAVGVDARSVCYLLRMTPIQTDVALAFGYTKPKLSSITPDTPKQVKTQSSEFCSTSSVVFSTNLSIWSLSLMAMNGLQRSAGNMFGQKNIGLPNASRNSPKRSDLVSTL